MPAVTTVTQKGQVTIPIELRRKLDLRTGSQVQFVATEQDDELILRAVPDLRNLRGSFKTDKPYSKQAAREAFLSDVLKNRA